MSSGGQQQELTIDDFEIIEQIGKGKDNFIVIE